MDKVKIGIPRSLYYYYYKDLWINFFEKLSCEVVVSPRTTREIMNLGVKYATDEMCVAMKNYLGHVAYLKDKCDYILIPRIDNYGLDNQTCTNYLSTYDIICNLITDKILNYNIDIVHHQTEEVAFLKLGKILGYNPKLIRRVYDEAKEDAMMIREKDIKKNMAKLKSHRKKILIVSHPYIIYDSYLGEDIQKYLSSFDVEIIYSDKFHSGLTNRMSRSFSKELYFKYSKESIGALALIEKIIDGVIFITAFPCGPDSLVNELVMRKLKIPYLNLIIDDIDATAGMETRIESFVDIIERNSIHE